MTLSCRFAICLGTALSALLCSVSHASETIKAELSSNKIQLSIGSVKAGVVTLDVSNAADSDTTHELVVLRTNVADDKLPLEMGRIDESRFKKRGEVEDIAPGKSKRLTLHLAPGHYVLVCNKPGHYAMGMHTTLVVEP